MTTPTEHDLALPVLRVTEVGEFIRHHSCARRFRLEINNRLLARRLPFSERLFNTLDPVLRAVGREREDEWSKALADAGLLDLTGYPGRPDGDDDPPTWEGLVDAAHSLESGVTSYAREVRLEAPIGAFTLRGRIDFVILTWKNGKPEIRLVECKASRRDRTYHRIQVALYALMVQQLLQERRSGIAGFPPEEISVSGVVARIDETTNEAQDILGIEPLDLTLELADALRLLATDGPLHRIARTDLWSLEYQLNEKCDGCVFNVDCLPETALRRRLELLGLDPSAIRSMNRLGIDTVDDLATLRLDGEAASALRGDPEFSEHLEHVIARARARRVTLPRGETPPEDYQVEPLQHAPTSQLPPHVLNGQRLVRIFLSVDYDYTENRVGALSAHVTTSEWPVHTAFIRKNGKWQPDPRVCERRILTDANGAPLTGQDGRKRYETRETEGREVIVYKQSPWTGDYLSDTGSERQLIEQFLGELVDSIAEIAERDKAPVHFYVWSRTEMTRLVEACARTSSRLLGALHQLLGCRESLEQLIFSCLSEEVDNRFALGWTGRGLCVVTSLRWFGRRYHWRRIINGAEVNLDHEFTQDLFDFKTRLDVDSSGDWAEDDEDDSSTSHTFEIRSRFFDSLPAPYWHAQWGTLPDPESEHLRAHEASAIRRYNRARIPNYLREYLRARTQALRWVEESVRFKNGDLTKPTLDIAGLRAFSLGVESAAQAGVDFLRLDHFVGRTAWIHSCFLPPASRVPGGRTIPLANVVYEGGNRVSASIDLAPHFLDPATVRARCPFVPGSFVRLTRCWPDALRGQTIGQLLRNGKTCVIESIDWESGHVELSWIYGNPSHYVLASYTQHDEGDGSQVFAHATLDESPSDFVAGHVEKRILSGFGSHVFRWLDPENPTVPEVEEPDSEQLSLCEDLLRSLRLPDGHPLAEDQQRAVLEGCTTRMQLLQGPPGTGKTQTTAVALLVRIFCFLQQGAVVIVAAHTHTAVDNLLDRISQVLPTVAQHFNTGGILGPTVQLMKVHTSKVAAESATSIPGVQHIPYKPSSRLINKARNTDVVVVGGTTSAVLKIVGELSQRKPWSDSGHGFQTPLLVVDEASMMVFPHFLSLATAVGDEGTVMLAGDHRQLAPILAHEWENEDRPPAVRYQPFASAYDAVRNLRELVSPAAVRLSALEFTFRLPPLIVDLIDRLYQLDKIELRGLARGAEGHALEGSWESLWSGQTGLFLILHEERASRQSNEVEATIVERLLTASPELDDGMVGVITPHRAQRALLTERLETHAGPVDVIDTVERLQGGERPVIVVSGTASDPTAIGANAEFLLNLNRSNVAFSRARDRLFVVCARSLLDHVPPELEHYEAAMLWKWLRSLCSQEIFTDEVCGHRVVALTVSQQNS